MCEDCGGICAILDRMIQEFLHSIEAQDKGRRCRFFHPMEMKGKTSGTDMTALNELVAEAVCINMTSQQLEDELKRRTGFPEAVEGWISKQKIPNGMLRKIILTNAERIVREGGARPRLTLLMAA